VSDAAIQSWDMQMGGHRYVYARWLDGRRINRVPLAAEALFLRMQLLADDHGNLRAEPFVLRSTAFPARPEVTVEETEAWLGSLVENRLVVTYTVDGERYAHIRHFAHLQANTGKQRHPLQRCPREPGTAEPDATQPGARRRTDAPTDAPPRSGAHDGAAGRTSAPIRSDQTRAEQNSTTTPSPGSAPNGASGRVSGGGVGGGGGGASSGHGLRLTTAAHGESDRLALEALWNDHRPTGWRIAGGKDSAHLGEALDAFTHWTRAPPDALRDPLAWLRDQAREYLASGEAKRTRNTLGNWLRKRKWQETPEQWNSGDDVDPAAALDQAFGKDPRNRRNVL